MIRLLEIPFVCVVVVITCIHAGIFARNEKISPWFHALWAFIYGAIVVTISYFAHSWWLFGIGCLIRFSFYNPILNAWRHEKIFYLSTSSGANASDWDKIELSWGKFYPVICILSFCFFCFLQLNRFI
jgi:hypothetical protein